MSAIARSGRSHLFLVRLWVEEDGEGQTECRGRLQQVVSGETHSFRGWPQLTDLLAAIATAPLAERDAKKPTVGGGQRK